jgi:hypothetical protein
MFSERLGRRFEGDGSFLMRLPRELRSELYRYLYSTRVKIEFLPLPMELMIAESCVVCTIPIARPLGEDAPQRLRDMVEHVLQGDIAGTRIISSNAYPHNMIGYDNRKEVVFVAYGSSAVHMPVSSRILEVWIEIADWVGNKWQARTVS